MNREGAKDAKVLSESGHRGSTPGSRFRQRCRALWAIRETLLILLKRNGSWFGFKSRYWTGLTGCFCSRFPDETVNGASAARRMALRTRRRQWSVRQIVFSRRHTRTGADKKRLNREGAPVKWGRDFTGQAKDALVKHPEGTRFNGVNEGVVRIGSPDFR